MYKIFITGTNSGIGLEFVKQYSSESHIIFASYLPDNDISELQSLAQKNKNIRLIPMDITDEKQISDVAHQLKQESIDILINNAGIAHDVDLQTVTKEIMVQVFTVNSVGPLLVTKHFIDHVARSNLKIIASISSRLGSIASNDDGDDYAYRTSKAALNMIMKSVAIDVDSKGIKILLFHPGSVKTNMNPNGEIDTQTSIQGMRKVILEAPRSLEQIYYTYQGKPLPW